MNFAPIAIAVEKVIAQNEFEILQEQAKDWHEKYSIAAFALVAAEAAKIAGQLSARVDACCTKYGDVELY